MQTQFLAQCINSANAANQCGDHKGAVGWCQQALRLSPEIPEAWYNLGIALAGLGKRKEGVHALEQARIRTLGSPDAQNSIGLAFINLGAYAEADRCLSRALELASCHAFAYSNLGRLRECQDRLDEAESAAQKAVELLPDLAAAHANLGGIRNARQNYHAAEIACRRAIELDPLGPVAWRNLGSALHGLKRYDEAESACRKAIELDPGSGEAWSNLAATQLGAKRYDAAEAPCRKAIELDPRSAEAWSNLGSALHGLKRYDEAASACRQAIALDSRLSAAWSDLCGALHGLRRFEEAEAACRKAIELDPRSATAWSNFGSALHGLRRYAEAESACQKAVEFDPLSPEAWSNLGVACVGLKKHEATIECLGRSLELDPAGKFLLGERLHAKMHICEWSNFDDDLGALLGAIARGEKASGPFPVLGLTTDPSAQRRVAESYVDEECPANPELGPIPGRSRHNRIRVGYYSADFRNHPVSFLMAEVFELHDRSKFELIGFSFGRDSQDEMRQRVSAAFDRFIDVRRKSDREIAEMSRDMGIDIAVDLGGFTEDFRAKIFASRAAPVQVSYIGYLGTMGAPYIDYLVADKVIIPPGSERHYAEKIVFLPSYQANDSKRRISDRTFSREELDLPATGFVFCCFNNTYKITPGTFDSWMRILARVAGSVLFLVADNDIAAANLRREAEHRGVDPVRLVFGKRLPPPEYLARYRTTDLFLDTLPYNAGTTASDALWAGLPVLTCKGESFASRVAASVLNAIDLPELVTASRQEYEDLAVELALDPQRLADIKGRLAQNRLTTPLFDTPRFTRNIEAAYTAMYERHEAGLPPDHICIEG